VFDAERTNEITDVDRKRLQEPVIIDRKRMVQEETEKHPRIKNEG